MTLQAEWRTDIVEGDSLIVVDDSRRVRAALTADAARLSRFLTDMGELSTWTSDEPISDVGELPESWGRLVLARADSGEVLTMDPELFWDGIYHWYRSRGVDYDTEPQSA
jgi:hypothetical protein